MDTSRTVTEKAASVRRVHIAERDALRRLELLRIENEGFEKSGEQGLLSSLKNQNAGTSAVLSTETAVAQLGLLTGSIPTTAIFLKLIFDGPGNSDPAGIVALTLLILIAIGATSAAGYFSGKLTGKILAELETGPWVPMVFSLPFIGATWGLLSGAAGGFILLGVGSIFGGAIGATVGAAVLTAFGILHRAIKDGEQIERNRFLPLAFGITGSVAAFILGL
ncbi:MAG: hypothetical protein OEM82_03985 [Acidobacteriota bacterium]|nr:hypothetical protein [Acidobacteriota bacterium]MDH3529781.1 hypothetical protein [Acidobacteriota bacterium]